MKLSDITAWLASAQPWAAGVALYAQLGTNATYQRLFALGETPYSRQVLVRELSAFVHQVREAIDVVMPPCPLEPPAASAPVVPASPPEPLPEGEGSEALQQVRQQLKAVRDERSHLHPQLTAKNLGKKARFGLACRILDLTDEEGRLLALEAHVRQHGRLPGPVPLDEVTDQGELRRLLANLRSRRSKLRQEPARAADLVQVEAHIKLIINKITPVSS